MARPVILNGWQCVLKVDGVDVKDYGMIVNEILDPLPSPKPSSDEIAMRHGAISRPTKFQSRQVTISGAVFGTTSADLLDYLLALKQLFQLHTSGKKLEVAPQQMTGYIWYATILSFNTTPHQNWYDTLSVDFNITLQVDDPFLEASSATVLTGQNQGQKILTVTNSGSFPTPLSIEFTAIRKFNMMNLTNDSSESVTGWTTVNCSLSVVTGKNIYGTNTIKMTQTAGGAYSVYKTPSLDNAKYYIFGCFGYRTGPVQAQLVTDLATKSGNLTTSGLVSRSFLKISGPADLVGTAYARLTIKNSGAEADTEFDGVFLYEITSAEYADANFTPPAYVSGASSPPYLQGARFSVVGKNLCPAGAEDFLIDEWYPTTGELTIQFDNYWKRPILIANLITVSLYGPYFHLPPGNYMLSFKYRGLLIGGGGGGVILRLIARTEQGASQHSDIGGSLLFHTLTVPTSIDTWLSAEISFTVDQYCPYVGLFLERTGAAIMRFAQFQIESGSLATSFEYFRRKSFYYNDTLDNDDKILIDCENKSVISMGVISGVTANKMNKMVGNFLELLPGTNNIILDDLRPTQATPHGYSSDNYSYELKYRPRKI